MVNESILSIQGLSKSYGSIKAVDSLDLEVKKGQVFGLLGPNGSGKTTTLSVLLGLIKPQRGEFKWFGKPLTAATLRKIGSILENPIFYPYLSATDNLKIIADIKRVSYNSIDEKLAQAGLLARKNHLFKTFSLGMKQRLAIAAALLGDPDVLILDEPTNGLDPQGIAEIRTLITDIAQSGKTILIASHLLDEVQKVCSHVAVLQNGKCLYSGKEDVMTGEGLLLEIMADNKELLKTTLENCAWATLSDQDTNYFYVQIQKDHSPGDLNRYLLDQNLVLNHLALKHKSLESHFLELLKNKA